MSYPGNASLSREIQERILTTFEQTLELAAGGNRQEAVLGCDFILRMDPAFAPARDLQARLEGAEGPVEVADLAAAARGEAEGEAEPLADAASLDEVDELDYELPDLVVAEPLAEDRSLEAALKQLLEDRQARRLIEVAEEHKKEVAARPDLRKLVEAAYSQIEAEPYVESFLDSARQALAEGNASEAGSLIEKARSLDPNHPGIAEIEKARASRPAPAPPARQPAEEPAAEPTAEAAAESGAAGRGDEAGARALEAEIAAQQAAAADVVFETDDEVAAGPAPPPSAAPPSAAPPPRAEATVADAGREPSASAGAPAADGGDRRIAELMGQGQEAFDQRDYQGAIDAWSRIFLIDIDHEEAAQRIEEARRLKAEAERRVEEVYHEAVTALDGGDLERATAGLQQVLEMQPGHVAAREHLEQIENGAAPAPVPAAAPPPPAAPGADVAGELEEADDLFEEEILIPPEPTPARPAAAVPATGPAPAATAGRSLRSFLYVGGAVLVLVLAVGYLAWNQWDRLFPNSAVAPVEVAPAPDPVDRATRMARDGRVDEALRLLRRLPPSDARYGEAQALIRGWEAAREAAESAAEPELTPEAIARRERTLERARQASERQEYLLADRLLQRAAEIEPLSGEAAELAAEVGRQLEPLRQQIELFEGNDWEFVLPALWQQHQAEPDNRDVIRLIVDCYYNLGVRDLQRNLAEEAVAKLQAGLDLAPGDADLQRLKLFAEAYSTRQKDLLYRIFVKYLPYR